MSTFKDWNTEISKVWDAEEQNTVVIGMDSYIHNTVKNSIFIGHFGVDLNEDNTFMISMDNCVYKTTITDEEHKVISDVLKRMAVTQ